MSSITSPGHLSLSCLDGTWNLRDFEGQALINALCMSVSWRSVIWKSLSAGSLTATSGNLLHGLHPPLRWWTISWPGLLSKDCSQEFICKYTNFILILEIKTYKCFIPPSFSCFILSWRMIKMTIDHTCGKGMAIKLNSGRKNRTEMRLPCRERGTHKKNMAILWINKNFSISLHIERTEKSEPERCGAGRIATSADFKPQ